MPMGVAEILHGCQLFKSVDAESFARLIVIARMVKFAKGQTIFRDGDTCPGVYLVGDGMVRIFKTGAGGKEHVLHIVGAGGTFAEVAAVSDFDCPAHAQAIEPTECVLLPGEAFRGALAEDHALCLGMLQSLTGWVKHLVGLMEDVVLRDAAGRLARYLLNCPTDDDGCVELPTFKRHVASHLNLTSETFSRGIRRLIDAQVIGQRPGQRLVLLDRDALKRVADGWPSM